MDTRLASPSKALQCHHQASKEMGQSGKAAGPAGSILGKAADQGSTHIRGQLLPCPSAVLPSMLDPTPEPCPGLCLCSAPDHPSHSLPLNYRLPLHHCFLYHHTPAPCLTRDYGSSLLHHPPRPSCISSPNAALLSATRVCQSAISHQLSSPHHPFSLCFQSLSVFPSLECCETN